MIKLSCVNCGAPLEIGPDLDTFACGYCGTQQRAERKGGVVALKRVEAAIQGVQRGTDRTAAELALTRLAKEIAEAEASRNAAVRMAREQVSGAERSRLIVTALVAVSSFSVCLFLVSPLVKMEGGLGWLASFTAMLGAFVASGGVFRAMKIPEGAVRRITDHWDPIIKSLRSQVAENRALLDGRATVP